MISYCHLSGIDILNRQTGGGPHEAPVFTFGMFLCKSGFDFFDVGQHDASVRWCRRR